MRVDYTPTWSRLFLFLDEWLGIALLVHAWYARDWAFFFAFGIPWAVAVYGVGYRMQWAMEKRWWRLASHSALRSRE